MHTCAAGNHSRAEPYHTPTRDIANLKRYGAGQRVRHPQQTSNNGAIHQQKFQRRILYILHIITITKIKF